MFHWRHYELHSKLICYYVLVYELCIVRIYLTILHVHLLLYYYEPKSYDFALIPLLAKPAQPDKSQKVLFTPKPMFVWLTGGWAQWTNQSTIRLSEWNVKKRHETSKAINVIGWLKILYLSDFICERLIFSPLLLDHC